MPNTSYSHERCAIIAEKVLDMKFNIKTIFWIIWIVFTIGIGLMLSFYSPHSDSIVYRISLFSYVLFVVNFPLSQYLTRRKIIKLKRELDVEGDITIDQLETLRAERDYQKRNEQR